MVIDTFLKDPSAVLDYRWNWAEWLGADTIVSVTWVVPAGITQVASSNSATDATIWLSGGTDGTDYEVTCRITTTNGRTDDRTVRFLVRQR